MTWQRWIRRALRESGTGHFHVLLATLLSVIFLKGFEAEHPWVHNVSNMGIGLVLIAAWRSTSDSRKARVVGWVVLAAWGLLKLGSWVWELDEGKTDSLLILIFGWIVVRMVLALMRREQVSAQIISGSLCAYLLIGFWFWAAYGLVYALDHAAFLPIASDVKPASLPEERGDLFYFSFVTLTSLGYGDVTPVSAMARTLAILQVIFGQFYLAVLIARQVGLYLVQKRGDQA